MERILDMLMVAPVGKKFPVFMEPQILLLYVFNNVILERDSVAP